MTDITLKSSTVIIAFTILFIIIGWITPVMYATYAPQDQFLEIHEFDPKDTTVDSESHTVCFDRTVREPTTADIQIEMILLDGDSGREVYSRTVDTYFEEDTNIDSIRQPLPNELEEGEYKYEAVALLELANGRVQRQVAWTSDEFYVRGENSSIQQSSC